MSSFSMKPILVRKGKSIEVRWVRPSMPDGSDRMEIFGASPYELTIYENMIMIQSQPEYIEIKWIPLKYVVSISETTMKPSDE